MFCNMRLFLYEYATALPCLDLPDSIRREGRAMFEAVQADAMAIQGVDLLTLSSEAAEQEEASFRRLVELADWSLIIAPETEGLLLERCRWVAEAGGKYLGPSLDAVSRTGDKWQTYRCWQEKGVPTPETWCRENRGEASESTPEACLPRTEPRYVRKLRDGAGSCAMSFVPCPQPNADPRWLYQEYCPGLAVSVAFLVGPGSCVPLLPALQQLTDDGSFHYRGGEIPLPPALAHRCLTLSTRALAAISGMGGFVGVDLVLGAAPDGSQDYAIEINPRLTTSYVGLRALAADNLVELMLRMAAGEQVESVRWKPGKVTFDAVGQVRWHP